MAASPVSDWMPFYGGDFFRSHDVLGLSIDARYLYIEMLWAQWECGKLPSKLEVLLRLSNMSSTRKRKAWEEVKSLFVDDGAGGLINVRLAELRTSAMSRASRFADGARKTNASKVTPSVAPSAPPSGTPSAVEQDGDGQLQQQQGGALAPSTPQQHRLIFLLRLWDTHRTAAMQAAPHPTEALARALAKVDTPSRDWEAIIRDVTSWPALNGTAPPKPGYAAPYVLTFGKLLSAKIADAAERGEYRNENKLSSPAMSDGHAEILRRSVQLALDQPQKLKKIQ